MGSTDIIDLSEQYAAYLKQCEELGEDSVNYADYIKAINTTSFAHERYSSGAIKFWSTVLDSVPLVGPIKTAVEAICGKTMTGERYSDKEKLTVIALAVVSGALDVVSIGGGFFTNAAKLGYKEAFKIVGKHYLIEGSISLGLRGGNYLLNEAGLPPEYQLIFNIVGGIVASKYLNGKFNTGPTADDIRYEEYWKGNAREEFTKQMSSTLSGSDLDDAFEAFWKGDYNKMATYFDTTSATDKAVFWSGDLDGAKGYAEQIKGVVLETTPGGSAFDDWDFLDTYFDKSVWGQGGPTDGYPLWEALSSQYASGATGNVTFVHPEGYYGNMWQNVESLIVDKSMRSGKITELVRKY